MEIKIVFEIEKESRKTIDKFSEVIGILGEIDKVIQKVVKSKEESDKVESGKDVQVDSVQDNQVESTQVKNVIKNSDNVETYETVELPKEEEIPQAKLPSFTLEQLRAGCVESSNIGKGADVKKLLNEKYGVAKLDLLATENYDNFVEDLRNMGVRI